MLDSKDWRSFSRLNVFFLHSLRRLLRSRQIPGTVLHRHNICLGNAGFLGFFNIFLQFLIMRLHATMICSSSSSLISKNWSTTRLRTSSCDHGSAFHARLWIFNANSSFTSSTEPLANSSFWKAATSLPADGKCTASIGLTNRRALLYLLQKISWNKSRVTLKVDNKNLTTCALAIFYIYKAAAHVLNKGLYWIWRSKISLGPRQRKASPSLNRWINLSSLCSS